MTAGTAHEVPSRAGAPSQAPAPAFTAKPDAARLGKFALVGLSNTLITLVVFHALAVWLGLTPAWANVVGWLAGFANSFVWNRRWTFADRRSLPAGQTLFRFAVSTLVTLAVSSGIVVALQAMSPSGTHGALVLDGIECAAMAVSLAVNYTLSTHWAFAAGDEAGTARTAGRAPLRAALLGPARLLLRLTIRL